MTPKTHLRFDINAERSTLDNVSREEIYLSITRHRGGIAEGETMADVYLSKADALFIARRLLEELETLQ